MSWFDTAGFANLAKSALNSAQKRIDKALDISEDGSSSFTLPSDADSFFLSFGLGEKPSPSKEPTSKQPTARRTSSQDSLQAVPQASPQTSPESRGALGWGSFLEAASVVAKPFSDPPAILSQPTKAGPVADDNVPNTNAEAGVAGGSCGSESPLVIDFPSYASLELSVDSDGSTETLMGGSNPESVTLSSSQSRESVSDWQDSARESRDAVGVVVREPEHASNAEFPARQSATNVSVVPSTLLGSDAADIPSADATFRLDVESEDAKSIATLQSADAKSASDKAEVHVRVVDMSTAAQKSEDDECVGHEQFVVVESGCSGEAKAAVCHDLLSCGDMSRKCVVDESGDRPDRQSDDEKTSEPICSQEPTTPAGGSSTREEIDTVSVLSLGTSSSASFVQISAEETEDSRKSSSPSGDEETVSSSDIEIISSPNGGSSCDQFSGVSPARHLWAMGRRESQEEKRSESPEPAREEPDGLHQPSLDDSSGRHVEGMSEEERLRARVNELQGVLDARERKVFLLSKEVAEMSDSQATLQSTLQKLEELRARENQDTSRLTQEFTHRLAKLETRLLDTTRERDMLKSKLEAVQQESVTKVSISQMDVLLKEKDEQIAELMSEGEKLSKQHLQQSTIIKKLRAKEKDTENVIRSHKERLEEQSKELDRLRRSMNARDDQEKKHIDTIRQLTSSSQKLEREVQALQESLAEAHENLDAAMLRLDSAYSEMAELRQTNAELETHAEEATLSAKMAAVEETRRALDQTRAEFLTERTTLLQRIEELQVALAMADQRGERREEVLRASIRELQQQLQEAEARNHEITQNLSSATRPLLRQMENLQSTFGIQSSSWERVERSLNERLNESQTHCALLAERERSLNEKCSDLQLRVTSLEAQNAALRSEKQQLADEANQLRERHLDMEEMERREANFEAIRSRLEQSLRALRVEKEELSGKLKSIQEELESEQQKGLLLQNQLQAEREKRLENSTSPSPTVSNFSSVSDTFNCNLPEDLAPPYTGGHSRVPSLYESLRVGGSSLIESLQSQLKMREGEVGHLQAQITQLERCRESLSQEVISLGSKHELWEQELAQLREVKTLYEDTSQKYNTLLQMYGEKVEEAEELRLDLEDVKSMYKAQINELISTKQ